MCESRLRLPVAPFAFLGNISYSCYLIHFPLQLAVFAIVTHLGIGTDIFYRPLTLIAFFALLIFLSDLSYRRWERPAQRWLRARMPGRG